MPQHIIEFFNKLVKSQGLALAVLLAVLIWREWSAHNQYQQFRADIIRIEAKADDCKKSLIEVYQTDHATMLKTLHDNNVVLRQNQKIIENLQR